MTRPAPQTPPARQPADAPRRTLARTETYMPKHLSAAPTAEGGARHEPLGLGLRIISGIFLVNMCLTLAILVLSSRHLVDYNSVNLIDWLNLVFEAIALWMLWRRLRVGRSFVMGYTAFNIVVGTLAEIAAGTFDPFVQAFSVAFDVFLFLYFAFSPAVRRALHRHRADWRPRDQLSL